MNISEYREEIKLKLTGDLLETELTNETIEKIIYSALRELQRYITSTQLITVPYSKCINLSDSTQTNNTSIKVSSIANVYRSESLASNDGTSDPMQVATWQLLSGMGNMYSFQDAVYNYGSWNTLAQIRNTLSTDLAWKYDKASNMLYINTSTGTPISVTIEYIPVFEDVSQITSDYWIDVLMRLSIALTKVTVGRIRTRFTQPNALWGNDGDTLLSEGKTELDSLREMLLANSNLSYPID